VVAEVAEPLLEKVGQGQMHQMQMQRLRREEVVEHAVEQTKLLLHPR